MKKKQTQDSVWGKGEAKILQYLVHWDFRTDLKTLDAMVIPYWSQETKALMSHFPSSPDLSQNKP